jgi:hypothetical protein
LLNKRLLAFLGVPRARVTLLVGQGAAVIREWLDRVDKSAVIVRQRFSPLSWYTIS